MCFNQRGDIATLNGDLLKLVDKFTSLENSVSSTENDINKWLAKVWTAIVNLSVIWKSELTDKTKRSFFQAGVVLILLYGCTTWTLTKRMNKKIDGNYTRMLSPGGNTPQNNSCVTNYHSLRKLFKLDEPNMRDTAGELTHKRYTPLDPFTSMSKDRTTN